MRLPLLLCVLAACTARPTPPAGIRLIDLLPDAVEVPPTPEQATIFRLDALPEGVARSAVAGIPFQVERRRKFVLRTQLGGHGEARADADVRGLTPAEAATFGSTPNAITGAPPGKLLGVCVEQQAGDDGWAECRYSGFIDASMGAVLIVVHRPDLGARKFAVLESASPNPNPPASPALGPLVRLGAGRVAEGWGFQSCLAAPPTGRYVFDADVQPGSDLFVGTGIEQGERSGPMHFTIKQDGSTLLDEVVPPDEHFRQHRIPLASGHTRLTLEARAEAGGFTHGLWASPRILARSEAPNVLLVTIDALRADHLGSYGYARDTSPTLDQLARSGVRFERSTAQAAMTWTSVLSLLAGRYPVHTRVRHRGLPLPGDVPLLPDLLEPAGYFTFGGAKVADFSPAEMTGFDDSRVDIVSRDDVPGQLHHQSTVVTQLRETIEAAGQHPFFAWFHLRNPHYPLHPSDPLRYDPGYSGRFANELSRSDHDSLAWSDLTAAEQKHVVALYDSSIRDADTAVAALVGLLAEKELLDRTIVVVTADHGEVIGRDGVIVEHGLPVDAALHVPLIVTWPGHIAPRAAVSTRVQSIDIVPTILSLAGLPPAPGVDGRDLTPAMRGAPLPNLPAYADIDGRILSRYQGDEHFIEVEGGNEAKIEWFQVAGRGYTVRGRELYDLAADPDELHNLANTDKPRANAASEALAKETDGWPDGAGDADGNLTQDALEALRQAGYLQEIHSRAAVPPR